MVTLNYCPNSGPLQTQNVSFTCSCYLAYDLCIYIVWKRNETNETKRNVAKKNMKNSIWHED
jgi:hypothetical protein